MIKRRVSSISSILVSIPGLIAFFGITVIASILQHALIAGFCFCVFLISGISRLWGMLSIRKVSVEIDANSLHMFIGSKTDVHFSIKNEKFLPLIWLELLLPMPRRECFMPDENFEIASGAFVGEEARDDGMALKKRFSFIMGRDVLEWSGSFFAKGRGVYVVDTMILRAGDGFGLTQSQVTSKPKDIPMFVVYPEIRPVDITPFISMQWDGTGGEKGFIDDPTIMRGMRQYEAGDSWKNINWRMMARDQGININLYETVTPKAMHFILDGESFCNFKSDIHEFEETLSILASLLLRLTEARVLCGLSLPKSKHMPQTDVVATSEAARLLTLLADYDLLSELNEENRSNGEKLEFLPSSFEMLPIMRATRHAGRIYYVVRDAEEFRLRGFPQELDKSKVILLSYNEVSEESVHALGVRCMQLKI